MCFAMADSPLLKLLIGIVVLFIICIPEWFSIEGTTVVLSCLDPCSDAMSDLSTMTSTSLICNFSENGSKDVLETVIQNNTISSITLRIHANISVLFICDPQRDRNPLFQDMRAQGHSTNVSLELKGEYFVYSEAECYSTALNSQEDKFVPFSLEIQISNHTEHNSTVDHVNIQDMMLHRDFVSVSLQFESNIPFYTGKLGIVWLSLIPLVFVFGLIFVAYKVSQEKDAAPITLYDESDGGRLKTARLKGK